jgi:hypothetical protein
MMNPTDPDAVYGTLGRGFANLFGYLQALTIYVLLGLSNYTGKRIHLLGLLVLLPSLVLAGSRSTYFFLPLTLVILYRKKLLQIARTNFARVSIVALLLPLVLAILYFTTRAMPDRVGEGAHWPSLQDLWQAQLDPEHSTGRLAWVSITLDAVQDQSSLLVGLGPGMWGSKPASVEYSPVFRETVASLYSKAVPSQAIVVLGEYGIPMLLVFYALFYRLYRFNARVNVENFGAFGKSTQFALEGGLLILVLGGLIQRTWFTQVTAYYVWLLVAGMYLYATKFSSE